MPAAGEQMARVESVNIGKPRLVGRASRTGIYKAAIAGAVEVTPLGVDGDYIAEKRHHGGPDQAVYVYFSEDYAFWSASLGHRLPPGTFGDNMTIEGLSSADMAIGDRLLIGDELALEVTAPRIPCGTLATRMDDREFIKAFRDADRPGAYCRVITPGTVAAGDRVVHKPYAGNRVSIVEMYRDTFRRGKVGVPRMRELLAAPIAERARNDWQKMLSAAAPAE